MLAAPPAAATAITTAFAVRKSRSLKAGTVAKRSWLQKSGVQAVSQWMPVWQYNPEDKTSSVWVYASSTAAWPTQKLTYTGVNSLEEGRRMLQGNTVRCFPYLPFVFFSALDILHYRLFLHSSVCNVAVNRIFFCFSC